MIDPLYRRVDNLPAFRRAFVLAPVQKPAWWECAPVLTGLQRGAERRRTCRRLAQRPVLLDSRSSGDRRQRARRRGDHCADGISQVLGDN